jgi:hypothetical protein
VSAVERSARSRSYVTHAVKHFKNQPRGKRRIHMKPNISSALEIAAIGVKLPPVKKQGGIAVVQGP